MSLLRREGRLQAYVLVFMWLKWHGKGAEQRRVIGLLSLSKRVFLSRMIFAAVCCDRCALTTAFKESPDVMERIQKERKPMGIWWFIIILGIWILLQAYILPKLGIST